MPAAPARVLLVEGRDDRETVYQFCNAHELDNRSLFEVVVTEGFPNLRDALLVRPRTGVEAMGAVFDANSAPDDRWSDARQALSSAGYEGIPGPDPAGVFIPARGVLPRVGLWMMPDNTSPGMLEDFLQALVADADALLPRAQGAVDGIPPPERLFPESQRSKAVLHTWLAWQEEPGTSSGLALTRRYLDPRREPAPRFLAWLRRVFVEAPPQPANG